MKRIAVSFAALFVAASFGSSQTSTSSQAHRFALGLEIGTPGIGVSGWYTLSPQWVLRGGYAGGDLDQDYSTDGVDYEGSADLSNGFVGLQWHPGGGRFHLSGGAVFTENEVAVVGRPEDGTTFDIGGTTYPAATVGQIRGDVGWENSVAPFVGLGWMKAPETGGFGFFVELGAMFSGSAEAELAATGPIANVPQFQQDLQEEEEEVNDELDKFEVFPIARVGVMYRF